MSVYVGIDVRRKRSQVAVVAEDGKVQLNRNVVNGSEPMLGLIGGLPAGTPVAFEAAYGWGWLIELLDDYGFDPHMVHPLRCKAIASARLKNDPLTEHSDVSAGHRLGGSLPLRPLTCAGPYLRATRASGSDCATTGSGNTAPYRPPAFSSLLLVPRPGTASSPSKRSLTC